MSFLSRPEWKAQPRPMGAKEVALLPGAPALRAAHPSAQVRLPHGSLMMAVCTWWCFVSKLRLLVFLFPPSSDITVLSSCGRSCVVHTQVTSLPFTVHTGCLGEGVAGTQSEPRASMFHEVIAHLVWAAGCWALVIWGNAVSGFPGKFGKLQKQNKTASV